MSFVTQGVEVKRLKYRVYKQSREGSRRRRDSDGRKSSRGRTLWTCPRVVEWRSNHGVHERGQSGKSLTWTDRKGRTTLVSFRGSLVRVDHSCCVFKRFRLVSQGSDICGVPQTSTLRTGLGTRLKVR